MPKKSDSSNGHEMYYCVPWPECQKIQNVAPKSKWMYSYLHNAILIDSEWFDNNKEKHGL